MQLLMLLQGWIDDGAGLQLPCLCWSQAHSRRLPIGLLWGFTLLLKVLVFMYCSLTCIGRRRTNTAQHETDTYDIERPKETERSKVWGEEQHSRKIPRQLGITARPSSP